MAQRQFSRVRRLYANGQISKALEELMADGTGTRTAIMCAEAVPWRCHRSLIADALVGRGWDSQAYPLAGKAPDISSRHSHFEEGHWSIRNQPTPLSTVLT